MRNIEKISKIDDAKLSGDRYLEALLEQAGASGMLSQTEIEKLQLDCLALLAEKANQYNSGRSSSIPVDLAQNILTSIVFTIGLCLKTYPCPDDAVFALQTEPISTLYQKGGCRIHELIKSAKSIHALLRSDLMDTQNTFYHCIIEDTMNEFFQQYSPDFGAHETHITAIYPLCNTSEKLVGIEFIQQYLENFSLENQFCRYFTADDIHHLLCGLDENYASLHFNLYQPILTAAIGCVMSGANPCTLQLTPLHMTYLQGFLTQKSDDERIALLQSALEELSHKMPFNKDLLPYVQKSLPKIAADIEIALQEQSLKQVFLVPSYPEDNLQLQISFGEKMDDKRYCEMIEQIMQCQNMQDKIALIKKNALSLADLVDVLLDAELHADEVTAILKELSPTEIAAFIKTHPLPSPMDRWDLRESEWQLCNCLHDYVSVLPAEQQTWFKKAANAISVCMN